LDAASSFFFHEGFVSIFHIFLLLISFQYIGLNLPALDFVNLLQGARMIKPPLARRKIEDFFGGGKPCATEGGRSPVHLDCFVRSLPHAETGQTKECRTKHWQTVGKGVELTMVREPRLTFWVPKSPGVSVWTDPIFEKAKVRVMPNEGVELGAGA
jgi:hypothetical protein